MLPKVLVFEGGTRIQRESKAFHWEGGGRISVNLGCECVERCVVLRKRDRHFRLRILTPVAKVG